MIRTGFEQSLKRLHDEVLVLGSMVEEALTSSVMLLKERDIEGAERLIAYDARVNEKRFEIEEETLTLIATQQPVASDMRTLAAVLEIVTELERIGDYAKNIAFHSTTLDELQVTGEEQRLIDLGHAVNTMLIEVIQAYQDRDIKMAQTIRQQDVDIDKLYSKIFEDLLTISTYNGEFAPACTHLSFVGRSFERIGDHVTDIAEDILYLVQGEYPADDREKADDSAFIRV